MMNLVNAGFRYFCTAYDVRGRERDRWIMDNLLPEEGILYFLSSSLRGGTQTSTWYISLYSGSYTPTSTVTAATYNSLATEVTSQYDETNRVTLVPDPAGTTTYANIASPAIFTFNTDVTIRGAAVHSVATKGGTTGTLLSCTAAPSPKTMSAGEQLKVIAGLGLVNV